MVMQNTENVSPEQPESRWVIDLAWYEQNRRSFIDIARRSLCTKCSDKLQKRKKKVTVEDILTVIQDCCSKGPDFITARLPTMESVFRILLANGNQPMDVTELNQRLSLRRGGEAYTASPQVLTRLLANDRWYGFKQIIEEANPT